ncbi:MAG: hypothetical protein RIE86_04930 [Imperialibacter sp.]|uniref:AbiU2 domain-containing protein n=1 Tax=Imperialibacter sp. TaxID=2038411 RepID=UPI0032EFE1CD
MDIRIKKLLDLWVHFKYTMQEFDFLFSDKPEIVELRASTAPDFFYNVNELYWNHILITIAKLLDPYEQGKNTNLSLFSLPAILTEHGVENITDLSNQLNDLKEKYRPIINYRRKHLAHYDENYSTGRSEFNTCTGYNDVIIFLDEMLELINSTLGLLGLPKDYPLVMYRPHHYGARTLLELLSSQQPRKLDD